MHEADKPQCFTIVQVFVEEEAAKFLILMDAARCPRTPADIFTRHLGNFNQHLAKGLYSSYYTWVTMSLQEANGHLERERRTLYLDGPNGVDWIFRNGIIRAREEAMYVDYVATEEGHSWQWPDPWRFRTWMSDRQPKVLRVARALRVAGLSSPAALRVIADFWRGQEFDENVDWFRTRALNRETLELLEAANLLRRCPQSCYELIINEWRLPLYPLDLTPIEIDPQQLRQIQENWFPPDWY